MTDAPETRAILAVLYSDGLAADAYLAALGYGLRGAGVAVAGIVQRNTFVRNRAKCDMEVEELASGTMLKLSEDRGSHARGCRLDHAALSDATTLLSASLAGGPELVIVNKFGKTEAQGRGMRDALADVVQHGVPLIIGVPYRNLDGWRVFAGGLADEYELGASEIPGWLAAQGFGIAVREPGVSAALPAVNVSP